jgi:hypothetical protein
VAGDQYTAASEAIHTGTSALVVLDVMAGSGRRLNLNELAVTFNGTSSSAVPVIVRLVRTTVAPVGGGTITQAATPQDPAAPASNATAYMPTTASPGVYATTPPTVGVTLRTWYVPPTSGIVIQFPQGQEPDCAVSAGLGIQILAAADVQASSSLTWTE